MEYYVYLSFLKEVWGLIQNKELEERKIRNTAFWLFMSVPILGFLHIMLQVVLF